MTSRSSTNFILNLNSYVDESASAALLSSFLSAYSHSLSSHIYLISEGTTLGNKVWESRIQLLMRLPVFICDTVRTPQDFRVDAASPATGSLLTSC